MGKLGLDAVGVQARIALTVMAELEHIGFEKELL